ncbi:MAG TPA: PilZ domain-containing protein [Sphingomicrobium sp.]
MAILAHLDPLQRASDRRVAMRRRLKLPVYGSTAQGEAGAVVIHDLSVTGLLLETSDHLLIGESIEVELPDGGPTTAIVMWNSGNYYGCQFHGRISPAAVSASVLRSPFDAPANAQPAETQREFSFSAADVDDDKLPGMVRAWILVGLVVGTWTLIYALVHWVA